MALRLQKEYGLGASHSPGGLIGGQWGGGGAVYPEPSGKAGAGSQGRSPRAGPPDLSMDPGRREGGTKPAGVSVEVQAAGGCREHVLTSQDTQRRGRATVTVSHWYVSRLLLQSHSLRVASPASPPPSPTPPPPPRRAICPHTRAPLCPALVLARTQLCDAVAPAAAEPFLVWTSVCLLQMCGL